MTSLGERFLVDPGVRAAIDRGRPVVALESTLVSHGLPYPENLAVARASEQAVRDGGAVPATITIRDGRILVGLTDEDLTQLATAPSGTVMKASRSSLAVALTRDGWAATTVSATLIAAAAAGIRVMATGGIGGVHRGALGSPGRPNAPATLDISTDLEELARTPVAVVCAGPKAILDLPMTLEYLETRGVPVVAVGQDEMPGFYSIRSGVPAPAWVADAEHAAAVVRAHLELRLGSGILVCLPVPAAAALPSDIASAAIDRAIREADEAAIGGPALTPWLLARIAELTAGASVRANVALIVNNAAFAASLAVELAGR